MSTPTRVLIVDDDAKFRGTMKRGLEESGLACADAEDGEAALELLSGPEEPAFDVILLDVMMPKKSGWDVLSELRAREIDTPVIFLTARNEIEERVKGLQLGADDYLPKPFAFQELLARIQAVLRRRSSLPVLSVGDLRIDLGRRIVARAGRRVDVSPQEFALLRTLAEEPGRVFSRRELLRRVWNLDFDPGTNVVQVQIARLRRKLGVGGGVALIETIVGEGYRLLAPSVPGATP